MNTEQGHILLPNGNKIPIGILTYTPSTPRFQIIRGIGGESERVLVGQDSGNIRFVVNPQHGVRTGTFKIELPNGQVIEAHITEITHETSNGKSIEFGSGFTN